VNTFTFRFFAVTLALFLSGPVISQSLKIETIPGAPWGFIGDNGKVTGMMYEIGNRIAEEAGFNYTNLVVPYARTAIDVESGRADFVLRFPNDQLMRVALPVAKIVTMPIAVLGPSGTQYHSLSELSGQRIGYIRTSKLVEQFDSNTTMYKYEVNDYEQMAKMLAAGRLDAGIGSISGLYYGTYMAGVRPEQLGVPLIVGYNDFVLFFSRKTARPETITALKNAVKKLTASGETHQIVNKYNSKFSINLPSE